MNEDQIQTLLIAARAQTVEELKALLRNASPAVLQKVAVDIVPTLMRVASYEGEALGNGEQWAQAVARSRMAGLPPVLVRVHRGAFREADGRNLLASMHEVQATQVAVAFIADRAVPVQPFVGDGPSWTLDLDGIVNLMLAAGLGVTRRTFEANFVDAPYFRE